MKFNSLNYIYKVIYNCNEGKKGDSESYHGKIETKIECCI